VTGCPAWQVRAVAHAQRSRSRRPQRASANGFAHQTGRDGEGDARRRRRSSKPFAWSTRMRRDIRDDEDARHPARNPEVAGSNPAPATKARGPFSNRKRAPCMWFANGFASGAARLRSWTVRVPRPAGVLVTPSPRSTASPALTSTGPTPRASTSGSARPLSCRRNGANAAMASALRRRGPGRPSRLTTVPRR
jgi:hypothetical protein